jgi:hypothetical protein
MTTFRLDCAVCALIILITLTHKVTTCYVRIVRTILTKIIWDNLLSVSVLTCIDYCIKCTYDIFSSVCVFICLDYIELSGLTTFVHT